MHNIKIIDNVFDISLFEILQERLSSPQISWFFGSTTYKNLQEDSIYGYSFEHIIADNGVKNSPLYDTIEPLLQFILRKNNILCAGLVRIRLGMITAAPKNIIHKPHVDFEFPNNVGLIYFNDTNAPTYFYNEAYTHDPNVSSFNYYEENKSKFVIQQTVDCVANRLVLFNGGVYHSSSAPINTSKRIVLSFNYV